MLVQRLSRGLQLNDPQDWIRFRQKANNRKLAGTPRHKRLCWPSGVLSLGFALGVAPAWGEPPSLVPQPQADLGVQPLQECDRVLDACHDRAIASSPSLLLATPTAPLHPQVSPTIAPEFASAAPQWSQATATVSAPSLPAPSLSAAKLASPVVQKEQAKGKTAPTKTAFHPHQDLLNWHFQVLDEPRTPERETVQRGRDRIQPTLHPHQEKDLPPQSIAPPDSIPISTKRSTVYQPSPHPTQFPKLNPAFSQDRQAWVNSKINWQLEPSTPDADSSHNLPTPSRHASQKHLSPPLPPVLPEKIAQSPPPDDFPEKTFDLSPDIIEGSPVLQRWLRKVPNVLTDIKTDPSFRTRLRLGYSFFPSTDGAGGLNVGIEDVFIGRTGLTLSGEYHTSFDSRRELLGGDLRYYVRPLGSYINVAPVVGYRHLKTSGETIDGANVGVRLLLALSRTGAADVSLTQSWVSPGSDEEVGLTSLSFGYAVTQHLRLSTDLQKQNSRHRKDSRVGIVLEWMF